MFGGQGYMLLIFVQNTGTTAWEEIQFIERNDVVARIVNLSIWLRMVA